MSEERTIAARDAAEAYAQSQIAGASAGQLVVILYDYTIGCCRRGDGASARRGLVELMSALDLDHVVVAGPLFRVYEYLLDIVRSERFDEARETLETLRAAWIESMARSGNPAAVERTEV